MPTSETLYGLLKPDGTLELHQKPTLPAGPVRVILEFESPCQDDPWGVLQRIWNERKARRIQARSAEEIDTAINALRNEWEQRQKELEQLQEAARRQGAE